MITTAVKLLMPNSTDKLIRALLVICCFSSLLALAGCAGTSTTIIEEEAVTNTRPMYSYKSLLIKDLVLKRKMYTGATETEMSQRERRYERLPSELSDLIERYVKANGTYSKVTRNGKSDAATLLLTGNFTRLGRFKISLHVILLDGTSGQKIATFRQTLWDVLDTADSVSDLARGVADFLYRIQYK